MAGFLALLKDMPRILYYMAYSSYLRYTLEAMVLAMYSFGRENLACDKHYCHYRSPLNVLDELDMRWVQTYRFVFEVSVRFSRLFYWIWYVFGWMIKSLVLFVCYVFWWRNVSFFQREVPKFSLNNIWLSYISSLHKTYPKSVSYTLLPLVANFLNLGKATWSDRLRYLFEQSTSKIWSSVVGVRRKECLGGGTQVVLINETDLPHNHQPPFLCLLRLQCKPVGLASVVIRYLSLSIHM